MGIMENFVAAVQANDPSRVLSGAEATWQGHRLVFAAERARLQKQVIHLD